MLLLLEGCWPVQVAEVPFTRCDSSWWLASLDMSGHDDDDGFICETTDDIGGNGTGAKLGPCGAADAAGAAGADGRAAVGGSIVDGAAVGRPEYGTFVYITGYTISTVVVPTVPGADDPGE